MKNITFEKKGDVISCSFEGGVYKQVGDVAVSAFKGKTLPRRYIRGVIKDLIKLTGESDD